jgi:VWFA-related protein
MKRSAFVTSLSYLFIAVLAVPATPQNSPQYTLRTSTELVLVNVTVRDKQGNFVRDLKAEDFRLAEDGKAQEILSVDVENTDAIAASDVQVPNLLGNLNPFSAAKPADPNSSKAEPAPDTTFKDRRLIVLFFDLSSMQPDEVERAADSAVDYVKRQMAPADLVGVVSLANKLNVVQDFTTDRDQLQRVLDSLNPSSAQGFQEGTTGDSDSGEDTGQAFTADDTEFNIFNTDRRLQALQSLAQTLGKIDQKKSVIYFSSGMSRTGVENQSQLRAATNAAVRANLSFYTVDVRGLQAIVPGGDASSASQRGTGAYSGKAIQTQYDSTFASQETLVTLASDTGGRAFLDTNDFRPAFSRVQEDTAMYYVLAYRSSNTAKDGRFRRITVTVKRPDLKIDFRRGYYAEADFQHSTKESREQQLQEQIASDLPNTDLPVYLSSGYFRLSETRYFMPISLVVPGSAIPFTRASDEDRATLDILGVVSDSNKRPFGTLRDTIKLGVNTSQDVKRKNVQYDSGFLLPPGKYHLKFVLRENQTGQIGSFETDTTVPNLKDAPVKVSTVIASNQKQPAKQKKDNPLVRGGSELIPSVTHVFSSGQHLYLYYEIYDPARSTEADVKEKSAIRVLTNATFFKGNTRTYETPLVRAEQMDVPDRRAATFELDIPLTTLKPGFYTCQVNVIDDAAGRFVFPRLALLVR